MVATDGYFTYVASQPQLACGAFIIAEPSEVISLELSDVNIDCNAGDFIKVGSTHHKQHTQIPNPYASGRQEVHGFAIYTLKSISSSSV